MLFLQVTWQSQCSDASALCSPLARSGIGPSTLSTTGVGHHTPLWSSSGAQLMRNVDSGSTRFRTTMLVIDDCCHGLALQHEDWHRPSHPRGTLHRRTALGGNAAAAEWGGSICSSRPACQKRYTLPLRAQADKIRRLYRTAMLLVRLYRTAMLLVRSICLLNSSPQFAS